jgi:hypothetical protein
MGYFTLTPLTIGIKLQHFILILCASLTKGCVDEYILGWNTRIPSVSLATTNISNVSPVCASLNYLFHKNRIH